MDARLPFLLLLLGALCAAPSHGRQGGPAGAQAVPRGEAPELPGAEGALQNDVFLPVDPAAVRSLAQGDAALLAARDALAGEARRRDADRLYGEAFDAWRSALAAAPAGSLAWHPSEAAAAEHRLAEALEVGLRGRVDALAAPERERWRARFDGLAAAELRVAGRDTTALAAVASGFPGTEAAARAALALCDLALEAGRLAAARAWLARAGAPEASAGLKAALEARGAWLAGALPPAAADAPPLDANRLVPRGSVALEDPMAAFFAERGPAPTADARGVRPGAVQLADGRLALQTHSRVHLLRAAPEGLRVEGVFDPGELAAPLGRLPGALRGDGTPGWPLLPATDGRALFLVQGRGEVVESLGADTELLPNGLVCVRPPPPRGGAFAAAELPELRWALSGDRLLGPDGVLRHVPALAALAGAELQPGPVVAGDTVVVQARTQERGTRAWLLGLDVASGELRFARFLAQGSDLAPEAWRFSLGRPRPFAAQPLALAGGLVFAGTHLGTGSLVDPLDGRVLWTLKIRRRDPAAAGWSGDRPPVAQGEEGPAVLFAPADSDRLYALRADGPVPPAGGLADLYLPGFPPLPLGSAEAVLGLDAEGAVLAGRAGPERAVFRVAPSGAARADGVPLGEAEHFSGPGLVAGRRALALSNRALYLFDLERELYLADMQGLDGRGPEAGELFRAGDLYLVVGARSAAAFQGVR